MIELKVDIILCPAQLMPAPKTGVLGSCPAAGIAPYIPWNVLDFPAGVAPITSWNEEDATKMNSYPTDYKEHDVIKEACEGAIGLPLGVQVVGRPSRDMKKENELKKENLKKVKLEKATVKKEHLVIKEACE